jgi:hypothetical protein
MTNYPFKRYALVTLTWDRDNPAAYMPSNYQVTYTEPYGDDRPAWRTAVIEGRDNAGWTLDGYVLPRLASGGMHGKEVGLDHPIFKRVPA